MSDENGRPERIAGDPKLIRQLIARDEAQASDMTDEQLEAELEMCRRECVMRFPRIEEARTAYQYPSQAFHVFDRVLKRRKLAAKHPDVPLT